MQVRVLLSPRTRSIPPQPNIKWCNSIAGAIQARPAPTLAGIYRQTSVGFGVVGVDGRQDSEAAVGFAFDEAAVRGVDLVAVMAFDSWTRQGFARRPINFDVTEAQEEHAVISEQLAGWAEKYPDVRVQEHVFRGRPAECLLGYAGHAPLAQQPQLIVVGSRGRGGLTGLLLGSTSHAVIAHATCPVVVVRPSAG